MLPKETMHFDPVGSDKEVPSSSASTSSSNDRRYRFGYIMALSSLVMSAFVARLYYSGGNTHSSSPSLRDPTSPSSSDNFSVPPATTTGDVSTHFIEASPVDTSSYHNPLPSSPANPATWSPFPVKEIEEHTLGYPFVAACTRVEEGTKSIANQMAGEFDILDVFSNDHLDHDDDGASSSGGDSVVGLFAQKEPAGLFEQKKTKTWTYSFLLHDAEDLSYFLSFGLDYVPDLVSTRDLQDSRIGISHEDDDDSGLAKESGPGRSRRLAKPQCNDGTCRKVCGECFSTDQECTTCLGGGGGGGGGGGDSYAGTGECAILTPTNYNAKFTPGLLGTYGAINNYNCYRTVLGTNNTVDDMLTAYPNLTQKVMLDQYPTHENGYYLYVLVLTNKNFDSNAANPSYGEKGKVLATSSIHSREFTPAETLTRFAEYLLQNYDNDPDIRSILDWNEIHLILHANPDGRKYDEVARDFWRKNRRIVSPCTSSSNFGTDLNRNFPFKHNGCLESGCSSGTCSSETYRGDSEGSEQETKAIVEYAKTLFPSNQRWGTGTLADAEVQADLNTAHDETNTGVFMDVHSYGKYVGYAWGYKNLRSGNDPGLGALGRKMASYNEYQLWAPEMPANQYPVDGDTLDTMYGYLGVAATFWELGTGFYQSCTSFPTVVNEAFPGLLYAAKVAKSPFITSKGPDVLCLSLSAKGGIAGESIVATVDVSDSIRANHADDGGTLFATGGQNVASVELYVDCHPNEGCAADVTESITSAATTVTGTALTFAAPSVVGDHVLYVRAVDSDGYAGAVTAREFITCPAGGCPFTSSPTRAPTAPPVPAPAPVCDSTCLGCFSKNACTGQGCQWKGQCRPR